MNDLITLKLTANEMDLMFSVISQRPWVEVNAFILNVQRQIQEQQNARPRTNSTTEPDATGGPR